MDVADGVIFHNSHKSSSPIQNGKKKHIIREKCGAAADVLHNDTCSVLLFNERQTLLHYIYQDVRLQRRNSNLHVYVEGKKKAGRGAKLFVNMLTRIRKEKCHIQFSVLLMHLFCFSSFMMVPL